MITKDQDLFVKDMERVIEVTKRECRFKCSGGYEEWITLYPCCGAAITIKTLQKWVDRIG